MRPHLSSLLRNAVSAECSRPTCDCSRIRHARLYRLLCRRSGSSLESARLVLECLLQGGDGFATFFDGRFDRALIYAVSDLTDGVREVVLNLHDAQGCPNDRVARNGAWRP